MRLVLLLLLLGLVGLPLRLLFFCFFRFSCKPRSEKEMMTRCPASELSKQRECESRLSPFFFFRPPHR